MRPEDSGQAPEVSLVICTRNRLPSLERSVQAALAIETTREWELIVVDMAPPTGPVTTCEIFELPQASNCLRSTNHVQVSVEHAIRGGNCTRPDHRLYR